jgi:putative endonuclease
MEKQPAVYILANKRNGTLYVGVTSDFMGRISEHKQDLIDGFTKRYGVHRLVYIEFHETMDAAIGCEKKDQALAQRMEARSDRKRQP